MLTCKNKKETEKEHSHIEVYYNGNYLGYIIKSLPTEPKGWAFVNKSQYPLWQVKVGVNRVLFEKTKEKLIETIKEKLGGLEK